MIDQILKLSKTDGKLSSLLEKVQEYAQFYNLAKKRQKGCNEMGEVATLKDEFIGVLDEMFRYCKGKKYLTDHISYDIDLIADEIIRMTKE